MSGGQLQKDATLSCCHFVPLSLVSWWGSSSGARLAAEVCSRYSSGEESGDEGGVELDSLEFFLAAPEYVLQIELPLWLKSSALQSYRHL